jgi:hypothetical protein
MYDARLITGHGQLQREIAGGGTPSRRPQVSYASIKTAGRLSVEPGAAVGQVEISSVDRQAEKGGEEDAPCAPRRRLLEPGTEELRTIDRVEY